MMDMMKKRNFLKAFLAVVAITAISGCGGDSDSSDNSNPNGESPVPGASEVVNYTYTGFLGVFKQELVTADDDDETVSFGVFAFSNDTGSTDLGELAAGLKTLESKCIVIEEEDTPPGSGGEEDESKSLSAGKLTIAEIGGAAFKAEIDPVANFYNPAAISQDNLGFSTDYTLSWAGADTAELGIVIPADSVSLSIGDPGDVKVNGASLKTIVENDTPLSLEELATGLSWTAFSDTVSGGDLNYASQGVLFSGFDADENLVGMVSCTLKSGETSLKAAIANSDETVATALNGSVIVDVDISHSHLRMDAVNSNDETGLVTGVALASKSFSSVIVK